MPRPTTKADLLATASEEYEKLWKLIASMSEEVRNADFNAEMAAKGKEAHWSRDKNLRDVLVHLHEWHKLFILWESENMSGANKIINSINEKINTGSVNGRFKKLLICSILLIVICGFVRHH